MKIVLETERTCFRKFTLTNDDATLLYNLNLNPNVRKYVGEPEPTFDFCYNVIENIILPQYNLYNHGRWAVHLKENDEFVGWCGLKYLKERDVVDLGYRFFEEHWGKGLATECAKANLHYGFETLQLNRIIAVAHIENIASQNVIIKCGLQFFGENFFDNCPVKQYEITKEKYFKSLSQ